MDCPKCRSINDENSKLCAKCGTSLIDNSMQMSQLLSLDPTHTKKVGINQQVMNNQNYVVEPQELYVNNDFDSQEYQGSNPINDNKNHKKGKKKILIILLLLILGIVGFIGYKIFFTDENSKEKLIIQTTEIELEYGSMDKIDAILEVDGSENEEGEIIWTSSQPDLVTVDEDGYVHVHGNVDGEVIITATSKETGVSKDVTIKVNKVDSVVGVQDIVVDKETLNLMFQQSDQINTTIVPENATNKGIIWTSSDPKLVTIDNGGNVKAIANKNGEAILTVKTLEGGFTKTVKVNVVYVEPSKQITSIKLDKSSLSLKAGQTAKLKATITPSDALDKTVTWTSSDKNIVTVDSSGNIKVTGVKNGTATITAKTVNGKKATCKVTVSGISNKAVKSISLDKTAITLTIGDRFKVTPTITPSDATNKTVTYTSGTPLVASVDENGIITAHSGGVSTITVKTSNGKTAKITVTVQNPNLILEHGYLKTSLVNNVPKIVNQNGTIITLRGYNVGAWLSRSYSMSAVVPLDETLVKNGTYSCINNESFHQILRSRFSEAQVDDISETWYNNFMQQIDWDLIAQTGANVIRLPFEYGLFDELGDEKAFTLIDKAINECKKRGIYVIIDMHLVPGRQNGGGYCGIQKFFEDPNAINRMVNLWGRISARYANEPAVAAYDLLNEPAAVYKDVNDKTINKQNVLLDFYNRAYQAIRAAEGSKNHIIIMEEDCVFCGYGVGGRPESIGFLPSPTAYGWTNVMYSTHDYFAQDDYECTTPTGANEVNKKGNKCVLPNVMKIRFDKKLALIKQKMNTYKIPYYIGEFSYLGNADNKVNYQARYREYLALWQYAMGKYDESGISYTAWTYKANHDPYFGTIYYGTTVDKANLLVDSYATLKAKFSAPTTSYMKFNSDLYGIFTNQFGGRYAQGITLDKTNITLSKGQTAIINYTVTPSKAIQKQATWKSSNNAVATVDANTGKITAVASGTATITAVVNPLLGNTVNSYPTATITVTVK